MSAEKNPSRSAGSEQAPQKQPQSKEHKKKKDEKKDEAMSDEDLALKQQLELYVERVQDSDASVQKLALESMRRGRESLKYRLLGYEGDIGSLGHEYVRNLAGEIAQEFQKRQYDDMPIDALMELVQQIVAFHMSIMLSRRLWNF